MGKPIQTKFITADLTTPLTFDLVIGTDTEGVVDNVQLLGVYFKAVSNITETITTTLIAKGSTAVFTFLLDSTSLTTAQTVVYTPSGRIFLKKGDTLRVEVTSSTATVDGSVMIQYREAD